MLFDIFEKEYENEIISNEMLFEKMLNEKYKKKKYNLMIWHSNYNSNTNSK